MRKLRLWLAIVTLLVQISVFGLAQPTSASSTQIKELNFVLLHGAGSTSAATQSLGDIIESMATAYISGYELSNPGTKVKINILNRSYTNDVDVKTWANNIAVSINQHFQGKSDLILVGHSMGGKAALYAVAQDSGNIASKVGMVVTINSPVKALNGYYAAGGGSATNFCRVALLLSDNGVCDSAGSYDSSIDGQWVSQNKRWLAFVSAESAPMSPQFDRSGVDPAPRDMDDGVIPISAQYNDGADVVYYGQFGHSDFGKNEAVANFIADQILRYIFGGSMEFSVQGTSGEFEHHAGWLPIRYTWQDELGQTLWSTGKIQHTNKALGWQTWEDIVGGTSTGNRRSSFTVKRVGIFSWLTRVEEARWQNLNDPADYRLYIKTRAAPLSRVTIEWSIWEYEPLPPTTTRDHYEIRTPIGTPLAGISQASWITDDPRDVRLKVSSQADGPFRWFLADWRIFSKESRPRKIIDEIPAQEPITIDP